MDSRSSSSISLDVLTSDLQRMHVVEAHTNSHQTFASLPVEIKLFIWKFTLLEVGIHHFTIEDCVELSSRHDTFDRQQPNCHRFYRLRPTRRADFVSTYHWVSTLLSTCYLSRVVALDWYQIKSEVSFRSLDWIPRDDTLIISFANGRVPRCTHPSEGSAVPFELQASTGRFDIWTQPSTPFSVPYQGCYQGNAGTAAPFLRRRTEILLQGNEAEIVPKQEGNEPKRLPGRSFVVSATSFIEQLCQAPPQGRVRLKAMDSMLVAGEWYKMALIAFQS